jgi:hypothetical protein
MDILSCFLMANLTNTSAVKWEWTHGVPNIEYNFMQRHAQVGGISIFIVIISEITT